MDNHEDDVLEFIFNEEKTFDEKVDQLKGYCDENGFVDSSVSPFDGEIIKFTDGEYVFSDTPIDPLVNCTEMLPGYASVATPKDLFKSQEQLVLETAILNMVFHAAFPKVNLEADHRKLSRDIASWPFVTWDKINKIQFPPADYLIENILPKVGFTMLGGAPKDGKSFLCVAIARSIALGIPFLGKYKAQKGKVLTYFLEDPPQRVHSRLKVYGDAVNDNIIFGRSFTNKVIPELEKMMKEVPDIKLIILDTYAKLPGTESTYYKQEYGFGSDLHNFIMQHQVHVILVHHIRKKETPSTSEQFYGSQGVTGAADNLMILKRDGQNGVLSLQGRDALEPEISLFLDTEKGWTIGLDDPTHNMTPEQIEVYELLAEFGRLKTGVIAEKLKKERSAVSHLLSKMVKAGSIETVAFGEYRLTSDATDEV